MKPLFTVCLIARNESKTLPRLVKSLEEFQSLGGQIVVLDTGSSDDTANVARSLGCLVTEVGDKFRITIDEKLASKINKKFVVKGEAEVVKAGETLFDFASARNYAASLCNTDMVAMPDCDEIYTKLDLNGINLFIEKGIDQFEYEFVFAHDAAGKPIIQFKHSKFYNKKKMKWVGVVHEVLSGDGQKMYLHPEIIKLEHWQNPETNRSQYLTGLAVDCFKNLKNDRNSHYFAREMMYKGRFRSAIKEFTRHIKMNKWVTEVAQSMTYIGDCYRYLGKSDEALMWYHKSFEKEPNRREPLMKLAEYYSSVKKHQQAVCYATAALQVKGISYYSNYQPYYEDAPHHILYLNYWWLGEKEKSKEHFLKALELKPNNPQYINDKKFYL